MIMVKAGVTAPSKSWAARTRGASVRCLAVATVAVAHSPIATAIASPAARRAENRAHEVSCWANEREPEATDTPARTPPATAVAPAARATRRRIFGQPPARKKLISAGRAVRAQARTTTPVMATAASVPSAAAACHPRARGGDAVTATGTVAKTSPVTYKLHRSSTVRHVTAARTTRHA